MNDTTNNPGRRRKSSGLRKAIIAGVVLVAAGGGWYGWHTYKAKKAKEDAYLFAPVTRSDIEDLVTATGTVEPRDFVDVGAQVSGQIDELLVEVGDVVTKDQPLVKIDATTSQAKMDGSIAQLKSAKNNLLSQIETLEKSKRDVERQRNLYAQDATTKQSLQDAETAYKNAERTKTNSELSIEQQEASMKIDQKNLGFTTIVAPIDGTVMSIQVKKGQSVNATQSVPVVLRIANLNAMTVRADVSEADIAKLYPGISVYFTTLSSPRRWNGVLKRTEPTPKSQGGVVLYTALFDVENEGNALKPSQTAQVFFVNASATNVLTVPMAALQQGQQISRELAAKEGEKNGAAGKPAGMPNASGGAPGAAGAAAPGAAAAPATAGNATVAANAPREGGNAAPAATAVNPANAEGNRQGNRANGQGNRPNGQGNRAFGQGGQGMRAGQPGGNFNGPRPGGAGGAGGFQNMTPEQREEFARMRAQGGGMRAGGFNGQGFNGQRGNNMAAGATGAPRPAQRRNGTVMVKKADGTLEARRVVIGVSDRVHGEVIEGLKEGEEVVVGKRETETAARPNTNNNNQQNNNQNRQGGLGGGGFPGGGGFSGGGGGFPGGR